MEEGRTRKLYGFVLTLGYSRAMYADLALRQTLPTVGINLPVDTKTASTSRSYHLRDNIALRNALRT